MTNPWDATEMIVVFDSGNSSRAMDLIKNGGSFPHHGF